MSIDVDENARQKFYSLTKILNKATIKTVLGTLILSLDISECMAPAKRAANVQ